VSGGLDHLVGTLLSELANSPKRAEKSAKRALKSHPDQHDLLFVSGLIALNLDKTREARNFFLRSINTGHAAAAAYLNAGIAEAHLGDLTKALRILAAGRTKFPSDQELTQTTIKLAIAHGAPEDALAIARAALTDNADTAELLSLAGRAAEAAGNLPDALHYFEAALAQRETDTTLRDLSRIYAFTNQSEKALDAARRACALAPNELSNVFDLAWRETETGDFSAAQQHFRQSLSDQTLACEALRMLCELSDPPSPTEITALVDALSPAAQSQTDRGHLELARYHTAKAASAADPFKHLAAANRHYAKDRRYDAQQDRRYHAAILDAYDRAEARPPPETAATPRPVFILGMIRTGTTLLDRLLSTVPETQSLGEVASVDRFFRRTLTQPDPDIDLGALAHGYGALQALAGPAAITIDKMPANYMYIGWLHRAFPGCRIILMQRDMRDVAVSAFENYFNAMPMNFTFREDWLVQKFEIYASQIAAWEARNVAFLKVSYERLVSAPHETLSEIAAYCDLPALPEPAQATQRGSIRTASFAQARQGITTASVARWPAFATLLPALCKPG
jgi:tetratricopeptide (TPR) repeat protein